MKNTFVGLYRILLFLICFFLLLACSDSSSTIGKQPLSSIVSVEDHSEVLPRWAQRDVRDAVVLHFDAHDDIRFIPDNRMAILKSMYQQKDWVEFSKANSQSDNGLYNIGNFLYAAGKLGIIKQVYWVIPFPMYVVNDPSEGLRNLLRFSGFTEDDIRSFGLKNGYFTGLYRGVPLTLCSIENLPKIKQPVLLSLDVDFFPEYARSHSVTLLDGVRRFYTAAVSKEYRIKDAVISYSISGGYLKPRQRWVGDYIEYLLKHPEDTSGSAPERYLALQDYENLIGNAVFAEVVKTSAQKSDPAIKLYHAEALFGLEHQQAARSVAVEACKIDLSYCYGLPYFGVQLAIAKRERAALPFFVDGYKYNNTMNLGQAEYGLALAASGRLTEALAVLDIYRRMHGSYPVNFISADLQIRAGNNVAAYQSIVSAIAGMNNTEYHDNLSQPLADAVRNVMSFCKSRGYEKEYSDLDKSLLVAKLRQEGAL